MKPLLTPSQSVGTGLGVIGVVYAVHSNAMPPKAVQNATNAYDPNLENARKQAAIMSIGVVSAISLLTKDVNIFILGGAAAIALDWFSRYCIARHPATGQIVVQTPQTPTLAAVS